MMRAVAIALLILVGSTASQAQMVFSVGDYASDPNRPEQMQVGAFAGLSLNSTALTWSFIRPATNGSHIEAADKGDVTDRLNPDNRFGGNLYYRAHFSQPINSFLGWRPFELRWYGAVTDHQLANANFSEDLFQLGFYGNKTFAGDTAALGNAAFQYMRYQQLQLGLLANNGTGHTIGLGLAYLNGNQLIGVDAPTADFYTSPIGDELSAAVVLDAMVSDTGNTSYGTPNGWGLTTDLFYRYEYDNAMGGTGSFTAEVNDLGWMRWNNNTVRYELDSNLHWSGLVFNDLSQLTDSVLDAATDSVRDQLGYRTKQKGHNQLMPAVLRLGASQSIGKTRWAGGLEYRMVANYQTYLWLRGGYAFGTIAELAGVVSTGGYGPWGAGIEVNVNWNGIRLHVGSRNLEGLLMPRNSGAVSGWAGLRYQFG